MKIFILLSILNTSSVFAQTSTDTLEFDYKVPAVNGSNDSSIYIERQTTLGNLLQIECYRAESKVNYNYVMIRDQNKKPIRVWEKINSGECKKIANALNQFGSAITKFDDATGALISIDANQKF